METVYIYDALRTPRGRGKPNGSLHTVKPITLAAEVFKQLIKRNNIDSSAIEDICMGCVSPVAEQGGNIAKAAAMYAGLSETVPALSLNRFCSSGLDAINLSYSMIAAGGIEMAIAGGVESMSRVPIGSDGGAWSIDPELGKKTAFVPQGISADLIASLYGYTRNDVDEFALDSQKKAANAWKNNYFSKSIIKINDAQGSSLLDHDEHMRPETSKEDLQKLRPAFKIMGEDYGFDAVALSKYPQVERIEHVHHAGNSSGIVDGAAGVLLANKAKGDELGLRPRAKILGFAVTSTEPTIMLTGPAPVSLKLLKKLNLSVDDIDLFEINEAFAAVVLHAVKEMKVPMEKVNVNGGAIALGHPLGATGAILVGTALDELERRNQKRALITLCVGGGMGVATVIERVL